MTRTQQTAWIVGAIVAVALIFAFIFWPEPNLDGMDPSQKCEYRSHYKNRGGSPEACKKLVVDAAVQRLMRGY